MISSSWQLHYGTYMGMFLHPCCSVPYLAGLKGIMNGLWVNVCVHVFEDARALCVFMHMYLCVCAFVSCVRVVFSSLKCVWNGSSIPRQPRALFNQTAELGTICVQCSGLVVKAYCMEYEHMLKHPCTHKHTTYSLSAIEPCLGDAVNTDTKINTQTYSHSFWFIFLFGSVNI